MARRCAPVEREDVLAFLRAEESKHETEAFNAEDLDVGMRLRAKASILRTMIACIERGDHVGTVERG